MLNIMHAFSGEADLSTVFFKSVNLHLSNQSEIGNTLKNPIGLSQ